MRRILTTETINQVGKTVLLHGWVHSVRSHGKITFFDLRDRSGIVQVVTQGKNNLKPESVVSVSGKVVERPENLVNPKLKTGTVEIQAKKIEILNPCQELPLPIDNDGQNIDESIRLKYRYLDLRRPRLQKNIKIRSDYVQACREYLFTQDFIEIETPLLTKTTPEGSRDFIVPSRIQPGQFFALPQSPQQYKQLLMTAGFERYFQIARCLRDEDPRADRAFEHTQLDLEMSFVEREEVMNVVELTIIYALEKIGAKIKTKPFPIFTYQQAIKQFGADKFDLRTEKDKQNNILALAWVIEFPFFERTSQGGWIFTHNPFSRPIKEHETWLLKKQNIGKIITNQYDLICNGLEVGGGSLRSYKPELLQSVFEILGHQPEQIKAKFGHMLDAFRFGTPPHGGCAHGFERLLMAFFGEEYIREVQAFPQSGTGMTSVMDAPSAADPEQLQELHLKIVGHKTKFSGKTVYQKIINLLKDNHVVFTTYTHEPVFTSEQAAKIRGTSLQQGAKALVMIADRKPIMVVLSGATKVDSKKFKTKFKIKDLRLAAAEEVEEITGLKIGSIPPFGNIFKLITFVDEKLGENQEITFNAASHTQSAKMSYKDFVNLVKPQIGAFVV